MDRVGIDMVTEKMLDNAFEMAKEEIIEPENVTASDLDDFQKRFNALIEKLKGELE